MPLSIAGPAFSANRSPVLARRGVVASSQPLASQAGLSILMEGGNAADAAAATAATLALTEPSSTGLGGDAFMLYYEAKTKQVHALNGSGRAPAALNLDLLRKEHLVNDKTHRISDNRHAHAVTVPGACGAWMDTLAKFGTMPAARVLAPAIHHAETGFPVAPWTAHSWATAAKKELATARNGREMTIEGNAPRAGEVFRNPGLARTLRAIADGGKDAFYKGDVGRAIVKVVKESGGVMSEADLAEHVSTWETPISTVYRGHRVWECPPNGQGLAALIALNVLEGFDLARQDPMSVERWHLLIEAMRIAFADTAWYVADPKFFPVPVAGLLDKKYAEDRRKLLSPQKATMDQQRGAPTPGGGTVYFCTADAHGNACSFINSNYEGFGTGMVPAGCGFTLQNRGYGFFTDSGHPNALAPRKRPYHTIIPGMITRPDGSLYCPFGVMGGVMQPQGHMQVAVAMLDDGLDPQAAVDRPRFCIKGPPTPGVVALESSLPPAVADALKAMGHATEPNISGYSRSLFGRGQIIRLEDNGVWCAGSDGRADGCAMGY
jgi:gamma-glutamyltranspeptidase/glutathione hydrolase